MAERVGYMRRMHAALVAKREQLAALIIAEVGCSQGVTYAMQVDMPLGHVLTAIEQSLHSDSLQIPVQANPFNPTGPMILGSGTVEREAIGVVAGITGYNFSFLLNLAKVFPALLAGNTLVLKPSP
ncbi:aldehyde dehydrogenase family protein, partial [Escherichia coli]|uniref:aldehyde dehydrogenase family protein n=1 Tax=Escherichia coli TaxID=562 RepID=UPI00202F5101